MSLTTSPLTIDHAGEWASLRRRINEVSGLLWKPTEQEMVEALAPSSTFDPARQTWGRWSGGSLVAFATVAVRDHPRHDGINAADIDSGVHPDLRGRGISSALLELAEPVAIELATARLPAVPLVLTAVASSTDQPSIDLLVDHDYSAVRYFFEMSHDLSGEASEDSRTREFTPADSEATRLAHNDAFRTHWGSGPASAEKWNQFMTSAGFRPDLSRIVERDGEVLAYGMVSSTVPGEAYLELVGTRAAAQGNGLGRAVLNSVVAAVRAAGGFTTLGLDVDADNPSGAGKFYGSAGFVNAARTITYEKPAR
ncbi:GNAT family N-acetyltransferase [Pseudactinotalea sp. HY158]|uniref:GNAT family N-acetyltransferase n=1 Tax=Pseudactinotalea sp. HY158 TaxID=2654547 RepID=UPI00129D211A|nr:GNAT family N-acetyltransferase [Pseudactinotalea sp. HY158]QGH70632.1 GNAT family N-acetyltransferase [Pseudactinotalea sp. HY158]